MKIVYLCHSPLPARPGHGSSRTIQIVHASAALATAGCDVDLVFPSPGHGQPDLRAVIARAYGLDARGLPERLTVTPVRLVPRIRWDWQEGSFDLLGPILASRSAHDFVYTRDPLALMISLWLGHRTVFETFRVDLQERPVFALWRRYCYRHPRLAGVVAHSRMTAEAFIRAGIEPSRVSVAYNGHASEHLSAPSRSEARARLQIAADLPVVVYAGSVTPTKGLDAVVGLARQFPDVRFLLVGGSPGCDARTHGNVTVVPRLPPPEVLVYLAAADCLLVPPVSAPLLVSRGTVLPMKVFNYLAAGRPILAPDLPDVAEVLEDDRNALLVPPDNGPAAAWALRRLLQDEPLRERLAASARADAVRYTWDARGERVHSFLSRLADTDRGGPVVVP